MEDYITRIKYDVPYVPSSDEKVKDMMELARPAPGEKAVDLGSGEGKLVLALASRGVNAVGVEIDEQRVHISKLLARRAGLEDRIRIIESSFWEQDLSSYDLIVLYGVPSIMERLGKKISNEAKSTVRVVSNHFIFPDWKPAQAKNSVYLYLPQQG
jgi:16S rRNA A1518/A1519 N6-dimethyltransferase RsmA/KsgA/DIM1 with predicted DNA glycosylase/AP lyase activity